MSAEPTPTTTVEAACRPVPLDDLTHGGMICDGGPVVIPAEVVAVEPVALVGVRSPLPATGPTPYGADIGVLAVAAIVFGAMAVRVARRA